MPEVKRKKVDVDEMLEMLIDLAVDRRDLKRLLSGLPEKDEINPVAVEYELQILQILGVGWGISYFMEETDKKKIIAMKFWEAINELSKKITSALTPSLGSKFDYFAILKERVDLYVKAVNERSDVSDPGAVIGPLFAGLCGNDSDSYIIIAGKAAFNLSLGGVKRYLQSVYIDN